MKIKDRIINLISTCFCIGNVRLLSGTLASAAAALLYFYLAQIFILYLAVLFVVVVLGLMVCRPAECNFKQKDSPRIVIDEFAGMLIGLFAIEPRPALVVLGFFIFRALDILKPYPAGKLEASDGRFAVMLDDIVAGIYTNILLHVYLIIKTAY